MILSRSFFNELEIYTTPSEIIEFLYCKRFIYYMKCLKINQNEENRYKVQKGREIHKRKRTENSKYLRKKINIINKYIDINLVSEKYKLKGIVDEILVDKKNFMIPVDYKFAKYDEKIYKTYKVQLVLYSLMIEEIFSKDVKEAYLIYCRNSDKLIKIDVTENEKNKIIKILTEYKEVLKGYYPKGTKDKSKCLDCCYKNICIK